MMIWAAFSLAASLVWTQTSAPKIPEEARKSIGYYVGDWVGTMEEGNVRSATKFSCRWAPGGQCTVTNFEIAGPEGIVKATILSGWDPRRKQVVDHAHGTDGSFGIDRWTIKSENLEEGPSRMISADGKVRTGTCRIEKAGPDEYTFSVLNITEGDKKLPDVKVKFTRKGRK